METLWKSCRGKIINVEKQSLVKIKENKEIKNLIEAVGVYPYRYHNVKIVADADCLSGNTIIHYRNKNNNIICDKIENIDKNDINTILSYNFLTGIFEEQTVTDVISKPANKEFIEFTIYGSEKIQTFYDHGFPVYDTILKKIVFLNANQIDKNKHFFIAPKIIKNYDTSEITLDLRNEIIKNVNKKSNDIIEVSDELIGIRIKNIQNIGKQEKAYCFVVEQNHNFIIGQNNIVTFNCDGLHINVLVILIFLKYFPELIKEGRLFVVIPPLYGARKGKEFIPIYNVDDLAQYKEKGYITQRFKGLGEMTQDQMRVTLDNKIEYQVQYPKNQKIIDNLLKIITDTTEKRKYLNKLEFNFAGFIADVFNELTKRSDGAKNK